MRKYSVNKNEEKTSHMTHRILPFFPSKQSVAWFFQYSTTNYRYNLQSM